MGVESERQQVTCLATVPKVYDAELSVRVRCIVVRVHCAYCSSIIAAFSIQLLELELQACGERLGEDSDRSVRRQGRWKGGRRAGHCERRWRAYWTRRRFEARRPARLT